MNVSTAWIIFKIIDEVDTITYNFQLSTINLIMLKSNLSNQRTDTGRIFIGVDHQKTRVRIVSRHCRPAGKKSAVPEGTADLC